MIKKKETREHLSRPLNKIGPELNFASTEAYNFLRTNLSFSFPEKEGCKIIGITSSCPTEGKSFTVINLAYALAESENRVLIIDGDLRKPSIARILGKKDAGAGLSNWLAEQEEKIVHSCNLHKNINVIFSGDIPPNPSELLGSAKLKSAMDSLAPKYDYILMDLPPVNSVADPLVVSKVLDGMIIIVKHRYSRRGEVIEAVRQLQYVGAHILGFVYNGYRRDNSNYRYGYKKGYYKYYSYESPERSRMKNE